MNEENIPVITDREELYDKCENMEQLFDKYYLPLLDKHYSKTYKLQQENKILRENTEHNDKVVDKVNWENMLLKKENKQLKDNWNKLKEHLKNRYDNGTESISYRQVFMGIREAMQVLEIAQELEKVDSNE